MTPNGFGIKCAYPHCNEHYVGSFGTKTAVCFCANPEHKEFARREAIRRGKESEKREAEKT